MCFQESCLCSKELHIALCLQYSIRDANGRLRETPGKTLAKHSDQLIHLLHEVLLSVLHTLICFVKCEILFKSKHKVKSNSTRKQKL